jgi:hypothetical protein
MTGWERLVVWCKIQQESMVRQVELMESGKLKTGEIFHGQMVDKTVYWIEEYKRRLADIEEILGRHSGNSCVE